MATIELKNFQEEIKVNSGLAPVSLLTYKVGDNGNDERKFTLECAIEMAKGLRGAPIVGAYSEEKDDFTDHGVVLEIRDSEFKIRNLAVPFGFIPTDAELELEDVPNKNGGVDRYVKVEGYVWYSQYPQLSKVLEEGRPVSISLFDEPCDGHWEEEDGSYFYVFTEANIENVCILGDDVIPSFEEASIASKEFSVANNFEQYVKSFVELYKKNKGGEKTMTGKDQNSKAAEEAKKDFSAELEAKDKEIATLNETLTTKEKEFAAKDEEIAKLKEDLANKNKEFETLKEEKENADKEIAELKSFKENTIKQQKEEVVKEFSLIIDEDSLKKIELDKYETAEQLKKELSFVAYTSGAFSKAKQSVEEGAKKAVEEKEIKTFNTSSIQTGEESVPNWVKEVDKVK